nr:MAG TPA: hypothetical protein [Caudoviricetes sp.]
MKSTNLSYALPLHKFVRIIPQLYLLGQGVFFCKIIANNNTHLLVQYISANMHSSFPWNIGGFS